MFALRASRPVGVLKVKHHNVLSQRSKHQVLCKGIVCGPVAMIVGTFSVLELLRRW